MPTPVESSDREEYPTSAVDTGLRNDERYAADVDGREVAIPPADEIDCWMRRSTDAEMKDAVQKENPLDLRS